MNKLLIGGREIGLDSPPFIIAEMSANHNQDLERAKRIIATAKECGADAVKVQNYSAETLTINLSTAPFRIEDNNPDWNKKSLYDLYKEAAMPWEWYPELQRIADDCDIILFSTVCDETAVEFLEEMNAPCYKIGSFEINHIPLIIEAASTGKPIILSTGMATREEIDEALSAAHSAGCEQISLLKCTSASPSTPEEANILTIPDMRAQFGCEVGLSDHTLSLGVPLSAVAHGATIVEKHFTLARRDGGLDASFSLEPEELQTLVEETTIAWQSLGRAYYGVTSIERPSLQERRSLYIAEDMMVGDRLNRHNLRCIRPSYGLAPKYFNDLIGMSVKQDIKRGTPLNWEMVESKKNED